MTQLNVPDKLNTTEKPFAKTLVTLSKEEHIELKWQASHYRTQWQRACVREKEALAQIKALKLEHKQAIESMNAQIDDLKNQLTEMKHLLFGRSIEKNCPPSEHADSSNKPSRRRGQQPGSKGHGRKKETTLPVVFVEADLPDNQKSCSTCGLPFKPFPGTTDSDVVEIQVKAHVRRFQRKRYQRTCQCPQTPGIIAAPVPPKLIAKGKLGISVWVEILLGKYAFGTPVHRLLQDFHLRGLDIAQGTVTGGLQIIQPLFEPVVTAIQQEVVNSHQWHADETRWLVWTMKDQPTKHWLWVFMAKQAVYYSMDGTRASSVPVSLLKNSDGLLICDRYSGYKQLTRENEGISLAFCWAHVRRDFINAKRGAPELEKWSAEWVRRIARLYHLNNQRLECIDDEALFVARDRKLREHLQSMEKHRDEQLSRPRLREKPTKVLKSLQRHWEGLTRLVDDPSIPLDNNAAERALRNPVVGRKNYYGAGNEWSGQLTAWLFSIFMTLNLWGINLHTWLDGYLQACADNNRQPPDDLSVWLPWEMGEERLEMMRGHDPP